MLKEITSLFDYFKKVETGKEYELVAVYAYADDGYNRAPYTYEMAKQWIENWIKDTVDCGYEDTCRGMVDYLNKTIRRMNDATEFAIMVQRLSERIYKAKIAEEVYELERARVSRSIQEAQATGQAVTTAQQTPIPQTGFTYINTPLPPATPIDWTPR